MDFWSADEDESEFCHEHLDCAVEAFVMDNRPRNWPTVLHVRAMVMREVEAVQYADSVLENLLELLDDEYRENATNPTERMTQAAEAFCKAVGEEIEPYWCDENPARSVDVVLRDWFAQHQDELEYVAKRHGQAEFEEWMNGPTSTPKTASDGGDTPL